MFLFVLLVGAAVGAGVYTALGNGGWGPQDTSLGGVLGFFATVLTFYGLLSVRISR